MRIISGVIPEVPRRARLRELSKKPSKNLNGLITTTAVGTMPDLPAAMLASALRLFTTGISGTMSEKKKRGNVSLIT